MKNAIKLTALFLLASTAIFAATPSAIKPGDALSNDAITFSSLPSQKGVEIKIERATASKAIVIIYDEDNNVILKDALPAYKAMEKGYILNKLEDGDYTIEVISNKQVVKKDVHVYDEDRTRVFLVKQ